MITVQIYGINGVRRTIFFKEDREGAIAFAERIFKRSYVYKVKVWQGKSVPNMPNAKGLILELV